MKIEEFYVGQKWLTKCGFIAEVILVNDDRYVWPISCYLDDPEYTDEFSYNLNGRYDGDDSESIYDLVKEITKEENPEYFL